LLAIESFIKVSFFLNLTKRLDLNITVAMESLTVIKILNEFYLKLFFKKLSLSIILFKIIGPDQPENFHKHMTCINSL